MIARTPSLLKIEIYFSQQLTQNQVEPVRKLNAIQFVGLKSVLSTKLRVMKFLNFFQVVLRFYFWPVKVVGFPAYSIGKRDHVL